MLWVGDNVPPLLQLPSHMFSPAPSSLFPSQSSILQPAHLFELHTPMLDREEGPPESPTRRAQAVSLPYMKRGALMAMPFGLRRLRPPSAELFACRRKRHPLRGSAWPLLAMKMRGLAVGCAALPSTVPPGNQLLQVRVKSQGVPACSCQKVRCLRGAFCPIAPTQGSPGLWHC